MTLSRPIFLTGHVLLTPWPTWVGYVRSIVVVVVKKGIEGCMNAFILSYFGLVLCTLYYGLFSRNYGANLPRGLLWGDPKGQPWLGSPIWPHLRLTLTHHIISRERLSFYFPEAWLERSFVWNVFITGWLVWTKSELSCSLKSQKEGYETLSFIVGGKKKKNGLKRKGVIWWHFSLASYCPLVL